MDPEDSFTAACSDSEWYKGLEESGSCLKLYDLLHDKRELIHQLGPHGNTVLHKGVDHGCVKLVRFVLVDMFDEAGICSCKGGEGENGQCALTREKLLQKRTDYGSTAVNMAIVSGSPKMVLLLEWAIRVISNEKKTVNTVKRTSYPTEVMEIFGCINDSESKEIEPVANEVPNVKDDEISESIYSQEKWSSEKTYDRDMQLQLYEIITARLTEWSAGKDGVVLKFLMDRCAKNVYFEFVPVEHIFLHFLMSFAVEMAEEELPEQVELGMADFLMRFLRDIIVECKVWDEKNKRAETMQMTLFSILDPRGRTIMHTLFHTARTDRYMLLSTRKLVKTIVGILEGVASESARPWRCYTAKDGAGRTLYHMASIYDFWFDMVSYSDSYKMKPDQYPHVNIEVTPLCLDEFKALQRWSFGDRFVSRMIFFTQLPIDLAVLFYSIRFMSILLQGHAEEGFKWKGSRSYSPFKLACGLGRTKLVELFFEHQMQFKNINDSGFDGSEDYNPALHCAAVMGQVEAIQLMLKYPIYDPMCQEELFADTALHAVVGMTDWFLEVEEPKSFALHHVLPNSPKFRFIRCLEDEALEKVPRDFTKNEKICINLLLQAGIDLWTPNELGEYPNVGSNASNDARSWWYEKVVKEVEIKKASITSAANATSVIGALVATTSFIGPLQPPLSYSMDGYVNASPISIRIYLVCNSFSFFFSIASILMAVLPSISMPKESLYDEMIRSERSLKAAVTMLLISIICILVSFSSASLAVVSSEWHDRKLIVASMTIGGGVCAVVLVIFMIRLIRMVFHKSSWLRRKFAKHMYF